jgi:hypothetical protein
MTCPKTHDCVCGRFFPEHDLNPLHGSISKYQNVHRMRTRAKKNHVVGLETTKSSKKNLESLSVHVAGLEQTKNQKRADLHAGSITSKYSLYTIKRVKNFFY